MIYIAGPARTLLTRINLRGDVVSEQKMYNKRHGSGTTYEHIMVRNRGQRQVPGMPAIVFLDDWEVLSFAMGSN